MYIGSLEKNFVAIGQTKLFLSAKPQRILRVYNDSNGLKGHSMSNQSLLGDFDTLKKFLQFTSKFAHGFLTMFSIIFQNLSLIEVVKSTFLVRQSH